jgi:hypothetical protein
MSYGSVAYMLEFLLLILAGAFLARRHGRIALLLPLGFIIPFVLVGRYDETSASTVFLVLTSAVVFAYRILVTLIAPVWIVRSATEEGRKRAGVVGLFAAIGLVILAHLGLLLYWMVSVGGSGGYDLPAIYYNFSLDIILFAGMALASSLYQRTPEKDPERRMNAAAVKASE